MVYGQNVCINAMIGYTKDGNMKPVNLAFKGQTVCNNAWMDKIPANKLTPICKTECVDCKSQGKVYPDIHPTKATRVITQEQRDRMVVARAARGAKK